MNNRFLKDKKILKMEIRNLERDVLTPEYKSAVFQFNTYKEFILWFYFKLLCRTSWLVALSLKNNVYLCSGRYQLCRFTGGKSMKKGFRSNMHYSFLDRQLNSFLWAAYMMQRSLLCLLFSRLWWEKTKIVQKYKLHCFLLLPSRQILVVITCSLEPFKWGTVAKSIRDVQICKECLIAL